MLSSDWLIKGVLVERRNPSISNYIRDVINYLKKGFFLRAGYLLRQIPRYTKFPSTNTPAMSIKRKKLRIGKKKIPLLSTNQKTAFIYKVELTLKTYIYSTIGIL
jgi:hypothetical protein